MDESQKNAAREARPGATREAVFVDAAGDKFKVKKAIGIWTEASIIGIVTKGILLAYCNQVGHVQDQTD